MRSAGQRSAAAALAIVAVVVLLGAAAPQPPIVVPGLEFVPSPEGEPVGGPLGGNLGLLLLAGLALALIVAAAAAGVVLYRTRGSSRAARVPEEGWWTCANCGAGNIDGAARCHACSTWRKSAPHPTTTT